MMTNRISFLAFILFWLFLGLAGCAAQTENRQAENSHVESPWSLVWSDEFDGTELDISKWKPETSCWGGGNNERQCYTGRQDNIEVTDGLLHLKAKQEPFTANEFPEGHPSFPGGKVSKPYTSGKVRTLGLADWKYGRFEARMKLPFGQGTWPAFWMMSAHDSYGSWPLSGEIDILEAVNLGAACLECDGNEGENRSLGALHFGKKWPDNTHHAKKNKLPGGLNAKEQFHVFAVEWGEGQIHWLVDGERFFSLEASDWFTDAVEKEQNPNAPFDKPFYMMLNLAVGGGLSEDNNDKTFNPDSFPAELLVDWVRVYECKADPENDLSCVKT